MVGVSLWWVSAFVFWSLGGCQPLFLVPWWVSAFVFGPLQLGTAPANDPECNGDFASGSVDALPNSQGSGSVDAIPQGSGSSVVWFLTNDKDGQAFGRK